MGKTIAIVVGAGATLSDAVSRSIKRRPPLDRGFFSSCDSFGVEEKSFLLGYLKNNYGIDPLDQEHDSLERIMAIIYADISNPRLEDQAVRAFRTLIRLFNRRIAETTNSLTPSNRGNLYQVIAKHLLTGVLPEQITIITFNQDLQVEKVLNRLQATKKYSKLGTIFSFPGCYFIPDADSRLSQSPDSVKTFPVSDGGATGVEILKLHGSLNWYSAHMSRDVPKKTILDPHKKLRITARREYYIG